MSRLRRRDCGAAVVSFVWTRVDERRVDVRGVLFGVPGFLTMERSLFPRLS